MDEVASLPLVTYKVEVFTWDKRGAGTDANVSINLFGEDSESGSRILDNEQNNFERGKKDVFERKEAKCMQASPNISWCPREVQEKDQPAHLSWTKR